MQVGIKWLDNSLSCNYFIWLDDTIFVEILSFEATLFAMPCAKKSTDKAQ